MSRRLDNLTWSHHQAVATREDRLEWLAKAEAGGWPARELTRQVEASQIRARAGISFVAKSFDNLRRRTEVQGWESTWSELPEAPGRTPGRCGKSV